MRVAVTGAGGRLGQALVRALGNAAFAAPGPVAWRRDDFDLDAASAADGLLEASGIDLVIHAAAWTDVDGCALDPGLAMRRNAQATGVLAAAAAKRGIDLIVISTNEVFDGERQTRPYSPQDEPSPANPYGASKLAGERAAADAFAIPGAGARLGIVRTAWLFGSGRPDYPMKIALAARRAMAAGEPVRIVADEMGTPTYADDVAEGVVDLVAGGTFEGISHLVNLGIASRAEWGRDVLRRLRLGAEVVEVSLADFPRPSRPPRWGVLEPTRLPKGRSMRHWRAAMAAYAPGLRQSITVTQ